MIKNKQRKEVKTKPTPQEGAKRTRTVSTDSKPKQRSSSSSSTTTKTKDQGKKRFLNKDQQVAAAKRLRAAAETQRDARHEVVVRCNKLWNDLREKQIDKEKRSKLTEELSRLLKGKILSFSQRPDTSRVIQDLFKYGNESIRKMILQELATQFVILSKGKYSCFLVISLLRNGTTTERSIVTKEIREHARNLGTHAHGARVVNFCLSGTATINDEDIMNKRERKRFYERFYGSELTLLSNNNASEEGDEDDMSLSKFLSKDETKRSASLQTLKKLILKIAEKGLLRFPFAQFLCYQLISNGSKDDILDLTPSVTEACLAMVGTWEGTVSVVKCLIVNDAKDRKKMIKEWKGHICDLTSHKFGWYLISRALDLVDDTKLLEKQILEEYTEENIKFLILQEDGYGRKVFLKLLSPKTRYLQYFQYLHLFEVDEKLNTSKKDDTVRNEEIFQKIKDKFYSVLISNCKDMLMDSRGSDFVRELFSRSILDDDEKRKEIVEKVTEVGTSLLEDAKAHVTIKRIIQDETEFLKGQQSTTEQRDKNMFLACKLAEELKNKKMIVDLAKINRPAFVLESLLENPLSKSIIQNELKKHVKELPKDVKGSEALAKKLLL